MKFPFSIHCKNLNFIKNPVRCFSRFFYPFLILVAVITLSSSIFIVLGEWGFFQALLSKAFIAAGGRTISSLLIKMGFSGGLALAIAWSLRLFISESGSVMAMMPSGPGSGEGSSDPRRGNDDLSAAGEPFLKSSKQAHQEGQPAAPPQPLPVEPYPYSDDEIIGGDSVGTIQRRLLAKYPSPSAEIIELSRLEAQDLFEVKVKIIQKMAQWDPTGDWMGRGARALDNPRTESGEESLERLYEIWEDLDDTGVLSDSFSKLTERVLKKRLP